jgi:hypothetical protein
VLDWKLNGLTVVVFAASVWRPVNVFPAKLALLLLPTNTTPDNTVVPTEMSVLVVETVPIVDLTTPALEFPYLTTHIMLFFAVPENHVGRVSIVG